MNLSYWNSCVRVMRTLNENKSRLITSPFRRWPDFVIIGAMKSGTTSLYDFVNKHPAIVPAAKKEIHYFSTRHKYRLGGTWYRSNFPTAWSRRTFYKRTGQNLLSGEASPSYLFYPVVPGRMKTILPDVKLIAILRNPVDRAYSHYHHMLRKNMETMSFEDSINLEATRGTDGGGQIIGNPGTGSARYANHPYLARGVYADQLENWFGHYDRDQFLILATEDFRKNAQHTMDQVFDFLGARPCRVGSPRDLNVGSYEAMQEGTRKSLVKHFKPHNERLYKLLQRNFDWDR